MNPSISELCCAPPWCAPPGLSADVRNHNLKHSNIDLYGDGILKNRDSLLFTTSYTEIEISNSPIRGDEYDNSLDELYN